VFYRELSTFYFMYRDSIALYLVYKDLIAFPFYIQVSLCKF
jgi:hypothetical protein